MPIQNVWVNRAKNESFDELNIFFDLIYTLIVQCITSASIKDETKEDHYA